MQIRTMAMKYAIGAIFFALILSPSILTALVWTPLNFYIVVSCVLVSVCIGFAFSKIKWLAAAISSLINATPPYPHWLSFSDSGDIIFNRNFFFPDIGGFMALFLFSMLCFFVIFWSTQRASNPRDGLKTH